MLKMRKKKKKLSINTGNYGICWKFGCSKQAFFKVMWIKSHESFELEIFDNYYKDQKVSEFIMKLMIKLGNVTANKKNNYIGDIKKLNKF